MSRHRSAESGRFVDEDYADHNRSTTIAEAIDPIPGTIRVEFDVPKNEFPKIFQGLMKEGYCTWGYQPDGNITIVVEYA